MTEREIVIPFLKWAGGKRWLTQHPSFVIPEFNGRYIEPFLGSGSVFFSLCPPRAILADTNADLIEAYQALKDRSATVLVHLRKHAASHDTDHYYFVRDKFRPQSIAARAARFLYLNRTCWNGLYRVNLNGKFNVPKGTKSAVLMDTDDFGAVAAALNKARLVCSDFEPIINEARDGDFIFADPPYTTSHNHNGFIKYNEVLFSWDDQLRLKDALLRAKARGVKIVLSNADHASIAKLYGKAGKIKRVQRKSVISGVNSGRGRTQELLICL